MSLVIRTTFRSVCACACVCACVFARGNNWRMTKKNKKTPQKPPRANSPEWRALGLYLCFLMTLCFVPVKAALGADWIETWTSKCALLLSLLKLLSLLGLAFVCASPARTHLHEQSCSLRLHLSIAIIYNLFICIQNIISVSFLIVHTHEVDFIGIVLLVCIDSVIICF